MDEYELERTFQYSKVMLFGRSCATKFCVKLKSRSVTCKFGRFSSNGGKRCTEFCNILFRNVKRVSFGLGSILNTEKNGGNS